MTIRDMHLEVNQGLQKVAANKTRKYLSEEIDWILNKVESRFIQSKLRPRKGGSFSIDQLDIDAVRPLLVTTFKDVFIDQTRSRRYEVPLPMDYAYLISDSSEVSDRCNLTTQPTETTTSIYIAWLKKLRSAKGSAPYYETLSITAGANTVSIPSNLPYSNAYTGFQRKEDVDFLTDWLVHTLRNTVASTIEAGYERYGSHYKSNHFAFVSKTNNITLGNVIDGSSGVVTERQEVVVKQHTPLTTTSYVQNRLENSETVRGLLGVAFFAPSAMSPISELQGNTLYIYTDGNFTVNRCELTYIRKPRPMSLALGSDCELAEQFHRTLCDLAVEHIKNRLENVPGQQLTEQDIEKRIIL